MPSSSASPAASHPAASQASRRHDSASLVARPRLLGRLATGLALVALGVVIGQSGVSGVWVGSASAQADDGALPEELANEVRAVNRSLDSARDSLERQGRYVAATESTNSLMILSGGGDAIADLEEGNGVDPETFAALYAGEALPEVKEHLSVDDEGRLLYKGRLVRMYSKSRLKDLFTARRQYTAGDR